MPVDGSQKTARPRRSPHVTIEIPFGSLPPCGTNVKIPVYFLPAKMRRFLRPGTLVHMNEKRPTTIFIKTFFKLNGNNAARPIA